LPVCGAVKEITVGNRAVAARSHTGERDYNARNVRITPVVCPSASVPSRKFP